MDKRITFESYAPCRRAGCREAGMGGSLYCGEHRAQALAALRPAPVGQPEEGRPASLLVRY